MTLLGRFKGRPKGQPPFFGDGSKVSHQEMDRRLNHLSVRAIHFGVRQFFGQALETLSQPGHCLGTEARFLAGLGGFGGDLMPRVF